MNLTGVGYHPELGQLVQYEAFPLPDDPDEQVAQTICRMRRNVLEDARSPEIQAEARQIRDGGTGDPLGDAFWHVKNRVGFQRDEQLAQPFSELLDGPVVEILIRPRDLSQMERPSEDCDGFASYLPALVLANGGSCRFVTVAADPREPGRFSHVYTACTDPATGERVSLDSSHGPYPGWDCVDTGQVTRMKEWPIDGPDWGELLIIAGVIFLAAKLWGMV